MKKSEVSIILASLVFALSNASSAHAFIFGFETFKIRDNGLAPSTVCAPADIEKNIHGLERAALALATSEEFRTAEKFQQKVTEISRLKEEEKLGAFLSVVNVDVRDQKAVVDFLSAREPSPVHIAAAQTNLGLNSDQARTLVAKFMEILSDSINAQ